MHGERDIPTCAPARPATRAPRAVLPPAAFDCHFHVFGPHGRYPLSPGRGYTPPEATLEEYRRMAATVGLTGGVIVQPSVYGTDNACTLDALDALGPAYRGVVVVDPTVSAAELVAMDARGARGVRLNVVNGNGPRAEDLGAIAALVAPLGWHIQLNMAPLMLRALAGGIAALPVPVVIDHVGSVLASGGLDDAGFQALLGLVAREHVWVKLSGYRCSALPPPFPDVAPFIRALYAAAPDRCLWGTDWPHPIYTAEMPEDAELVDALAGWLDDETALRRVLMDNPARLYGLATPNPAS